MWRSGWSGILDSEVQFQQLEAGLKEEWKLGVRGVFNLNAKAGVFLDNSQMLFMDYKHFNGGLTELAPFNVTGSYRALDYYLYSTQKSYISALSFINFRKFLFTHIPVVRLTGVKENIIVNYLKTPGSPHYTEIGYSIDYLFNVLRIEFVQTFENTRPTTFAVRVGVASLFKKR